MTFSYLQSVWYYLKQESIIYQSFSVIGVSWKDVDDDILKHL
jgi:hypothetical protein